MESQTKLYISFKQNPAVAEASAGLKIGDPFEGEFKATVAEISGDGIGLNLEAIVPEGYEVAEPEETAHIASPNVPAGSIGLGAGDETIPSAIAAMVRRKKA